MPSPGQIQLSNKIAFDKAFKGAVVDGSGWSDVVAIDINELQALHVSVTGILPTGLTLAPPVDLPRGSTMILRLNAPGDQIWQLDAAFEIYGVPELWAAGKAVVYQITRVPRDADPQNDVYAINGTVEGHEFGQGIYSNFPAVTGVEAIVAYYGTVPIYRQYFSGRINTSLEVIGTAVTGDARYTVGFVGDIRNHQSLQRFPLPYVNPLDLEAQCGMQLMEDGRYWRFLAGSKVIANYQYELWIDYTKMPT